MTPSYTPHARIISVVVVEDDENDRELLVRQLRKSNLHDQVKFIADGAEALDYLSKLPPPALFNDLIAIFLDLKLPGIHGIDVLRGIRRIPRVQNTPVIVMTASIDPMDFEICLQYKVSAFIPKPVTFELFSQAIARLPCVPIFAGAKPGFQTPLRTD